MMRSVQVEGIHHQGEGRVRHGTGARVLVALGVGLGVTGCDLACCPSPGQYCADICARKQPPTMKLECPIPECGCTGRVQ